MKQTPFVDIEISLLNDETDTSSIELNGVSLCSCNEWDVGKCPQAEIHDTITKVAQILRDHRDGLLMYVVPNAI